MSERTDPLADDAITQFLRSRSADPELGLLDEIVRTVAATPQDRPWLGLGPSVVPRRAVLIGALVALLATMGAIGLGSRLLQTDPLLITFGGAWISTSDDDGGTQTMDVRVSADGAVDITVHDTVATVCSGSPSAMTGSGVIEDGARIVIASPAYTCDDGTQPDTLTGPPLEVVLRNWTLTLDTRAGTLTDGIGGVWHREGAAVATPESSPAPPAVSDRSWPQKSLEEVREAQELADAGDSRSTWQVDGNLAAGDDAVTEPLDNGQNELVDRFLREVLGWEAYIWNSFEDGGGDGLTGQQFLRCAPGRTNPLYPPQPDSQNRGESCAPTLDALTYEAVSVDLVQPERQGPGGIWVVSNWRPTTFAQVDPDVAEAEATGRLEEFLEARIAGRGAEWMVDVYAEDWVVREVPLLYATTSGAPYERFEFERVSPPTWPYGGYIGYRIRLFADDGTVVEQDIYSHWDGGASVGIQGGLALEGTAIENGEPVPVLFTTFDGEITFSSASQNSMAFGEQPDDALLDFTDPAATWSECAAGPVPEGAIGFAEAVSTDPNFETTAPVAARIGGVDAVALDVGLAPDGRVCDAYRTDAQRWIHALEPGKRQRLFLVDLPEGMSTRTLAITVMAPEEDFDDVIDAAMPIIESLQFHPDR